MTVLVPFGKLEMRNRRPCGDNTGLIVSDA
jgi:hypothetical protein